MGKIIGENTGRMDRFVLFTTVVSGLVAGKYIVDLIALPGMVNKYNRQIRSGSFSNL